MKTQSSHFQIYESYLMLYIPVMYFFAVVDMVKCIFFDTYAHPLCFRKMCLL